MNNKYELKAVRDSQFRPVKYRIGGKNHYQIIFSIKSNEFDKNLEKVLSVDYILHKSFKNRIRTSRDKENNFQVVIKTYGTFIVKVRVYLENREVYEFSKDYGEILT